MTSLLTNVSAMTALKSLNATNKSIETTQARISTGLAVGGAADNAAYWSIATTMRSDNKALGAVQDSLGLGAATIDVAYTAMDASKDVLDEIKTKLVAAKQPGVDKAKIQSEIGQLQQQLQGIASAASFSGNNWLAVDTASAGYKTTQQIVSSFSRGSDGAIGIGSVDIDVGGLALVDAANGGGTLLDFGGHAVLTSDVFAWDKGSSPAMDDGGTMFMKYVIDGGAVQTVTFTVADANAGPTLDEVVDALNGGLVGATASKSGDRLVVTSDSVGVNASVQAYDVYGHTSSDAYSDANLGLIYPPGNRDASGAPTGAASVFDIDITDPAADLDVLIADVDAASGRVISAAADLGAIKSRISMQSDFASALMDAVERGVGQLVDADMSKESTRLQALQVQQQLGIQSLSIANSNAQTILSLFR